MEAKDGKLAEQKAESATKAEAKSDIKAEQKQESKAEQKQDAKTEQKQPEAKIDPIEAERLKWLELASISLILDHYDDIFSDFDPRPFSQRALSDDFLLEAKKASVDKPSGQIELKFMIPTVERNSTTEATIKKRLREHFKRHAEQLLTEYRKFVRQGVQLTSIGIGFMILTAIILYKYPEGNFFANFLIILLEPASWFLFWEGMSQVIFESKEKKPDVEFYEKMSTCEIKFLSY
jgi:hypothetical protein